MHPVTGFESATPEQELAQNVGGKFDYSQVESALKAFFHDRTVAENVFARCAKHHFKQCLGDKVRLDSPELPRSVCPFWVASMSVVLYFDSKLDTPKLEELTESLATLILKVRKGQDILLVDSLSTRIMEVSSKMFKFSLQQKWVLDA